MSDVTISSMIGDIEKYKFNPVMIQRTALEALRIASSDTVNIVDPTCPFVFCLENTATNTAAFMQQNEASTRRLYSSSSLTDEDLYLHMSDKDYIGRFALPAIAMFTIMLSKTELLSRLILDPLTGIKKITIPRNTFFTVADTVFSLQYPVDIRLLNHGGLQIVYNTTKLSPLLTLTTNLIDWDEVNDLNNEAYIRFNVEANQFDIVTSYNDITAASGFRTDVPISDYFYHVRCYIQNNLGVYNEIQTTHTQQIYDPYTPTAVITVLDKNIKVVIPVIYTTSGLIRGKLRIDVYQTKGEIDMLLGNYNLEDFSANWFNVDKKDDDIYSTAIRNFKTAVVYSTTHVLGGRTALTFKDLRARVIKNAIGTYNLPVTNIQLQTSLEDNGYELVRNRDIITNRIYLATRSLPRPADDRIITAASASMSNAIFTLAEVKNCYGVIDNGYCITLTPKTLYKNSNGIVKPVTSSEFETINALPNGNKCALITDGSYLYSPFYYVLDSTGITFDVRAYYLDEPVILAKSFLEENVTTELQVSIDAAYSVLKVEGGYSLIIRTKSSDLYKSLPDANVQVQLSFKYRGANDRCYMTAMNPLLDEATNERVFSFFIRSTMDVDFEDYLTVNSFVYETTQIIVRASLIQEIDVLFTTNTPMPTTWAACAIDEKLGKFQLPKNTVGITHEKLKVRFGHALKSLWVRSRSTVDAVPYQTYTADVPAVYEDDVYVEDVVTGSIFSTNPDGSLILNDNGRPKYNILYEKGSPILDGDGQPTYLHRKDDIVYDANGNPVPPIGYYNNLARSTDILMIEGAYYFATDEVVASYMKVIMNSLLYWITVDLPQFNSTLLEQTKVYFYPKVTLGDIKVMVLNGQEVTVPAGQSLKVTLHVTSATYNNADLLASLTKSTIKAIDISLRGTVVSESAIEYALIDALGKDVINVDVSGIGGTVNYKAFTIIDASNGCSIRKRLSLLPDNKMVVEEDITVSYIEHEIPIVNKK